MNRDNLVKITIPLLVIVAGACWMLLGSDKGIPDQLPDESGSSSLEPRESTVNGSNSAAGRSTSTLEFGTVEARSIRPTQESTDNATQSSNPFLPTGAGNKGVVVGNEENGRSRKSTALSNTTRTVTQSKESRLITSFEEWIAQLEISSAASSPSTNSKNGTVTKKTKSASSSSDSSSKADSKTDKESLKMDDLGGSLSIKGRVITVEGRPVSGIPVIAYRIIDGSRKQRFALTNDNGGFAIGGLVSGDFYVKIDKNELHAGTSVVARAGSTNITLKIAYRHQVLVEGEIKDVFGVPIPGVIVSSHSTEDQPAVTDEEGRFVGSFTRASGRSMSLKVAADGFMDKAITIHKDTIDMNNTAQVSEILLRQGNISVAGVVLDSDGQSINKAFVQLVSKSKSFRLSAKTNVDGEFLFENVPDADDVFISAGGGREYIAAGKIPVSLDTTEVQLRIVLKKISASRMIARVVDSYGMPVPHMKFIAISSVKGAPSATSATDEYGQLQIDGMSPGSLRLQTQLSSPSIKVSGIDLMYGAEHAYQFTVDMGGFGVNGWIVDDAGSPVGNAKVSMKMEHMDGGVRSTTLRSVKSDASGYFDFRGLGAGERTITVAAAGLKRKNITADPSYGEGGFQIQLESVN